MNKIFSLATLSLILLGSCAQSQPQIMVTLENNSKIDRSNETIEIPWSTVSQKLSDATPSTVIVLDNNSQIASQVIFAEGDSLRPETLIFQSSLPMGKSDTLYITTGIKDDYPSKAFSRFVPERKDDYAWENNLVAQRAYGKALENELQTSGVDIWSKKVSDLIIDKWYKIDNYHVDSGEGLDNYKVGSTLGGGSSAPIVDGKIILSGNMVEWKRTANGPIRTEFTLSYAPYMVEGKEITMQKQYSLDANTRFTKVTDIYGGDFEQMPVGVGFVVHSPDAPYAENEKTMALYEPVSDGNPEVGGDIAIAIYVPQSNGESITVSDHKLKEITISSGKPSHYYIGSAWSKGGMSTSQEWFDHCKEFATAIENPITIKID